jgi:uncharacterized Ntn-hydrolase superfamily protein
MLIVRGESTGLPYKDKVIDLRVEDHPEPVKELRRLVRLNKAYNFMNEGDERIAANDTRGALRAYGRALELAPEITEVEFWVALTMWTAGKEREALDHFKNVFGEDKTWEEVLRRLPAAGLLEQAQLDEILGGTAQ